MITKPRRRQLTWKKVIRWKRASIIPNFNFFNFFLNLNPNPNPIKHEVIHIGHQGHQGLQGHQGHQGHQVIFLNVLRSIFSRYNVASHAPSQSLPWLSGVNYTKTTALIVRAQDIQDQCQRGNGSSRATRAPQMSELTLARLSGSGSCSTWSGSCSACSTTTTTTIATSTKHSHCSGPFFYCYFYCYFYCHSC